MFTFQEASSFLKGVMAALALLTSTSNRAILGGLLEYRSTNR